MYKLQMIIFILLILAIVFGLNEAGKIRARNKAIEEALFSFNQAKSTQERQQIADNLKLVFDDNKTIFDFSFSKADDGLLCRKFQDLPQGASWSELKSALGC